MNLIGKTFKAINSDPFSSQSEYRCRVLDVKVNHEGGEWVKYVMLLNPSDDNTSVHTLDAATRTMDLDTFNIIWKEVK